MTYTAASVKFMALNFVYSNWLVWFGFIVFNSTFNNISVISWQSVLLVEETGVPGECNWLYIVHIYMHV